MRVYTCERCNGKAVRVAKYDTFACPSCLIWTEQPHSEEYCPACEDYEYAPGKPTVEMFKAP